MATHPLGSRTDEQIEKEFLRVLRKEHTVIDKRRAAHKRLPVKPFVRTDDTAESAQPVYDTSGVALSGGGIRSAAFCLGALQGLAVHKLIDRVDYLSTVSGGGYIGSAVSAAMSEPLPHGANRDFPFAGSGEYNDRPSVGHLRDYSNYILPRGGKTFFSVIAVVLRGLMANVIFAAGVLFLASFLTVFAYPDEFGLLHGSFLPRLADACFHVIGLSSIAVFNWLVGERPFALTLWLLTILAVILALWAIRRSRAAMPGSDVRGPAIRLTRWFILATILVAALDFQPVAVSALLALKSYFAGTTAAPEWLESLIAAGTLLSGAVTFFRDKFAALLKSSQEETGASALLKGIFAHAVLWLAALVLPLLLWLAYLWLCASAISDSGGTLTVPVLHVSLTIIFVYLIAGVVLSSVTAGFSPNANSLHRLYRDKLSKAFLFDPDPDHRFHDGSDAEDLKPLDNKQLQAISPSFGGPYHLINAALNLQGSKYANRRGRNATFFLFSSEFVGSDVTGYAETPKVHAADNHVDLGTAMAISGAAVSPDMGSMSIKALAPTLALLNARLGYWMTNPKYIIADKVKSFRRRLSEFGKFYLWAEIFGWLNEDSPHIYLTDGGHIENLGIYELLKRRCRVIVAVDGEADPNMQFMAFSTLQRYARIDLGVRIDVRWQEIAQVSNAVTKLAEDGKPIPPLNGPHCALGFIHYPNGVDGLLLYVKASLTGDEADYVLNYKTRNPSFPHESTGDQFFTEEQFENYRALGFHALDGFFSAGQKFIYPDGGPWGPQSSPKDVRDYFVSLLV